MVVGVAHDLPVFCSVARAVKVRSVFGATRGWNHNNNNNKPSNTAKNRNNLVATVVMMCGEVNARRHGLTGVAKPLTKTGHEAADVGNGR